VRLRFSGFAFSRISRTPLRSCFGDGPPAEIPAASNVFLLREAPPISISNLLTCLPAIEQYWHIADMQTHPPHPKSFRLKILPISPYSSRILVLSSLQLHYFHRSGGRGVPRSASLVPLRERTTLEPAMSKVEGRRHRPRGAGALARGPCKESNRESFSAARLQFFRWK